MQSITETDLQPADYHTQIDLKELVVNVQKEQGWTFAPIIRIPHYKEATTETGDFVTNLNTSTTSRKLIMALNVAPDEMICTKSIKAVYETKFVIGEDKRSNWVLTADGTRPAGDTYPEANYKCCKPSNANQSPIVTGDGIFMPICQFASQFQNVRVQMPDNGELVDTVFESYQRSTSNFLLDTLFDSYVNSDGMIRTNVLDSCDPSIFYPDTMGNFFITADGNGKPTNDANFKTRVVKSGTDTKKFQETIAHRVFQADNSRSLFSSVANRAVKMSFWPLGCGLKLQFDLRPLGERIDTGLTVEERTSADGAAEAVFVTRKVYLQFTNCYISYQTIVPTPELIQRFNVRNVLGSSTNISTVTSNQFPTAPISRRTVSDLTVIYKELANGSSSTTQTINTAKDVLPTQIYGFVTKLSYFSLAGLMGVNWSGFQFCEKKLKKINVTVSAGSHAMPPFLQMYPGNDINFDDVAEFNTMLSLNSGQFYWNQNSGNENSSPFDQHAGCSYATWRKNGYRDVDMPARQMGAVITDVTTAFIKDCAAGTVRSPMDVVYTFETPIAGADWLLMCAYYNRSNLVIDIDQRNVDTVTPTFSIDSKMSGFAFR